MMKVLIVKDDNKNSSDYLKYLSKDKYFESIDFSYNVDDTLKKYFNNYPNILLVELNSQNSIGFKIIEKLSSCKNEKNIPNTIIISKNTELSNNIVNKSIIYKTILIENEIDYQTILKTLIELYDKINNKKEFEEKNNNGGDITSKAIKVIDQIDLEKFLLDLKINPYTESGRMVVTAIKIAYADNTMLTKLKDLYSAVAKEYGIEPNTVKARVRNSIDKMRMSNETLSSIFLVKIYDDDITPRNFFAYVVSHFKQKYKSEK